MRFGALMEALEWTRPLAGWSLLLPLLVLLLSFRRDHLRPVPLGTFALWQGLATSAGEVRRRRVTPARWLWIAAMCAACLALAGPRLSPPARLATLTVVVDRDAAMFLEHTSADGEASGRGTRLDSALADLQAQLLLPAFAGFDRTRVHWRTRSADVPPQIGPFPQAWLRASPGGNGTPQPWSRFDSPGTLWLTDSVDAPPARAGWVASGGGPVFGIAAHEGRRRYHWDGEQLNPQGDAVEPATVWLDPGLPLAVRSLAREWASVREHQLVAQPAPGDALRVHALSATGASASGAALAGRDGWSIDGPVARTPASAQGAALQTWLEARAEQATMPVVSWGLGVIHVGLGDDAPRGDPAAFAVSWSRLLDRACRPAAGVHAVAIRRAVGSAHVQAPGAREDPEGDRSRRPLGAWLACAAALCGFLALLLGDAGLR